MIYAPRIDTKYKTLVRYVRPYMLLNCFFFFLLQVRFSSTIYAHNGHLKTRQIVIIICPTIAQVDLAMFNVWRRCVRPPQIYDGLQIYTDLSRCVSNRRSRIIIYKNRGKTEKWVQKSVVGKLWTNIIHCGLI